MPPWLRGHGNATNRPRNARAESVSKAVLVTLGRYSDEARDTAKDNPVDLVDGAALATLMKKHLPQAYATRTV